jgi:hypothetical protein
MKTYSSKYFKKIKTGGKMKRVHFLLFAVCCVLLTFSLWSCGSGPGSPGSSGSEDTGVIMDAVITPQYNGSNLYSVDAFRGQCCSGAEIPSDATCSSGTPTVEVFTDHGASVTFTARLVNPNTTFQIGNLYIDKYTIEYRRSTDSIGAPPIQSDTRFQTITITAPTGSGTTTVTATLVFLDLIRKDQYASDMTSGIYSSSLSYINNYTAVYTFYGKNDYGKEFKIKSEVDFQIGDFDMCT